MYAFEYVIYLLYRFQISVLAKEAILNLIFGSAGQMTITLSVSNYGLARSILTQLIDNISVI